MCCYTRGHVAAPEFLSNPAPVASPSVFCKRVSREELRRGMKPLQILVRMIIICQSVRENLTMLLLNPVVFAIPHMGDSLTGA